jgi:hypothetical protein
LKVVSLMTSFELSKVMIHPLGLNRRSPLLTSG